MKPPSIALSDITHSLKRIYHETIPDTYKDENNHMNVRYYMKIFDDAGYPLIAEFGLTMAYHAQHGTGGFDLEHHLHYLNEVHIGDTVAIYYRVLARSAKRVHYMFFMVNETRQTVAATFECVNSFADLSVRRTAPYPPEIAEKIDSILAQHQALQWAAPVCGVMSA